MSGQATGWVLRHGPHPDHLDRHGEPYGARARGLRFVLHAVADAANRDGKHAHPGIEAVAEAALYGRRQTINLLAELVAEGWLAVEEEGGGKGRATVYSLPRMAESNGAVISASESNGAVSEPKQCNDGPDTVQSEAQTVQPRVHPNGLATDKTNGRTQRATRFPDEFFITDDMREWASREVPSVDLRYETAKFADHFRGSGVPKKDWVAAWRNWMRKSLEWGPRGQQQTTKAQRNHDAISNVIAMTRGAEQKALPL